jgi:hypothetical protein
MLAEIEKMDERRFKALTGLSKKKFRQLLPEFENSYQEAIQTNYERNKAKRERKPGGGRKGKLACSKKKLFFILRYFKSYPTYDELGREFELDRSKACTNVHKLAPMLLQTLIKLEIIPPRQFETLPEMREAFAEIEELFFEATEHPPYHLQDKQV